MFPPPRVCVPGQLWVMMWSGGAGLQVQVLSKSTSRRPACTSHKLVTAPATRTRRFHVPERFKWELQLPEHRSWMCFLLFFPPPVDKEGCSLLVKATFPLSQEQRCKAQPCKAAPTLSGTWAIFYIYQLSKETAGLAVCWQRQSTPFLYSTSPWMFTGTKHKRHSPVICLQSDFKDL